MKGQNDPPNDKVRREDTRSTDTCQRCGAKHALKDQYVVQLRGEGHGSPGKARVEKSKGAKPGKSHYCGDCGDTRKGELQRQLDAEVKGTRGKGKAKPKPKAKAKSAKGAGKSKAKPKAKSPKAKAKPRAKATKRTAGVKRTGGAKAARKETTASADPF
jgi:hypothetical protein